MQHCFFSINFVFTILLEVLSVVIMASCGICRKSIGASKLKLTCADCKCDFHAACFKYSKADVDCLTAEGLVWRYKDCAANRRKSKRFESKSQ